MFLFHDTPPLFLVSDLVSRELVPPSNNYLNTSLFDESHPQKESGVTKRRGGRMLSEKKLRMKGELGDVEKPGRIYRFGYFLALLGRFANNRRTVFGERP